MSRRTTTDRHLVRLLAAALLLPAGTIGAPSAASAGEAEADETRSGGAKARAVERTRGLIDAFRSVHTGSEDESLDAAQRRENEKTFTELDGYFDYDTLTAEPAAPFRDRFSDEDYERYRELFRELIRMNSYTSNGDFFRKADWELKPAEERDDGVAVGLHARIEEKDREMNIRFLWHEVEGKLRIHDLIFDGSSLVKDYRNQFARIVRKKGVSDLLKRLKSRYEEKRAEKGGVLP